MTHRDETEFVWAFDANGDRVRVPRSHLTVFGDALRLAPAEKSRGASTPATPDNSKEK